MTVQRDPRSGIHLTGADSGWPVAPDEWFMDPDSGTGTCRVKYGDGTEYYARPDAIIDGVLYVGEQVDLVINATGGSFTLEWFEGGVTDPIDVDYPADWPAMAATVQAALEAIPGIGEGNVRTFLGPGQDFSPSPPGQVPAVSIVFVGDLADRDLNPTEPEAPFEPVLVADYGLVTGGGGYVQVGWNDGSPG